jgi:hypothetical protein
MQATKHHRVFIVDAQGKPIGVIAMSDVLKFASNPTTAINLNTTAAHITNINMANESPFSSFPSNPISTASRQRSNSLTGVPNR